MKVDLPTPGVPESPTPAASRPSVARPVGAAASAASRMIPPRALRRSVMATPASAPRSRSEACVARASVSVHPILLGRSRRDVQCRFHRAVDADRSLPPKPLAMKRQLPIDDGARRDARRPRGRGRHGRARRAGPGGGQERHRVPLAHYSGAGFVSGRIPRSRNPCPPPPPGRRPNAWPAGRLGEERSVPDGGRTASRGGRARVGPGKHRIEVITEGYPHGGCCCRTPSLERASLRRCYFDEVHERSILWRSRPRARARIAWGAARGPRALPHVGHARHRRLLRADGRRARDQVRRPGLAGRDPGGANGRLSRGGGQRLSKK